MKRKSKPKKDVSLFKAYLVEIRDRWFSSRKRILKTVGVFTIPLIYGGVCIAAFWNPLGNIGTMPIALCSLDKEQMMIEDFNTGNQSHPVAIGVPEYYSTMDTAPALDNINSDPNFGWTQIDTSFLANGDAWDTLAYNGQAATWVLSHGKSIFHYDHTIEPNGNKNPNGGRRVSSLMDNVANKWQNGFMAGSGFTYDDKTNAFAIDLGSGFPVTNIKYHNTNNTDSLPNWKSDADTLANYDHVKNEWHITNNDDYAQITIPSDTTLDLISAIDASLSGNDNPANWTKLIQEERINLYVTYDRTFLAARLIEESMSTMSSLITSSLPMMGATLAEQYVNDLTSNISTISNWQNGSWNSGYSWEFSGGGTATFTIPAGGWEDHKYFTEAGAGVIDETNNDAITLSFQSGKPYTIQNEELRQTLIDVYDDLSAPTPAQDSVFNAISSTAKEGVYTVPSIEGYTTDAGSGFDKWNNTTASLETGHPENAANSLLHKLSNVTTAVTQIPMVDDAIAELMNFYINTTIGNMEFNNGGDLLVSVDINGANIRDLFSSDEFLCSVLTQDPRFMMLDTYAPKVPIIGNIPQLDDIDIGLNLRLGNVIALGCYSDNNEKNTFQQYDFRSSYTKDNTQTANENSYVRGDPLFDLLGGLLPDAAGFNIPANFSHAVNDPTLVSSTLGSEYDTQDPFSYSNNLLHNFKMVESTLSAAFGAIDPSQYIDKTVIGSEWSFYGIGLGQYFVCIGLCVGTLTQIMLYDKKKRVKRIHAKKWFMSKSMMMMSTSLIQSTVLAAAICAIGWWQIGNAMVYQWLFMIFCGLIFVCIIQGIWFSFRDRTLAFFCVVLFMVTNLAAGWGTFPSYMQWPVFEWLSYITPFTYMIHVQSAIAYGIATGTNIFANTIYILENMAILVVFAVAFYALGLFMSSHREREIYYGTWKAKKLGMVLRKLKYEKYYYETKKGPKADWKMIPHEEMKRVKVEVQKMFPYETFRKSRKSKELIRDILDFDSN